MGSATIPLDYQRYLDGNAKKPISNTRFSSDSMNAREYSQKPYIARNYRLSAQYFYCWQYGSILISFRAFVFENRSLRCQTRTGAKTELTWNSHSRSLKEWRSGVLGSVESQRHCVSRHNNAGLISKVSEDIAGENTENCRCQRSHCLLPPLPTEPPRISA